MVWNEAFVDWLLHLWRSKLFPVHGSMVIAPKSTVGFVNNDSEIPCVPLVQNYLSDLLLSLFHCMIRSDDFLEISLFSPFPPESSIQEAIPIKKHL